MKRNKKTALIVLGIILLIAASSAVFGPFKLPVKTRRAILNNTLAQHFLHSFDSPLNTKGAPLGI